MATNQEKLDNLWNGFFGDNQKGLWERGAALIAPILIKAYLDTPIKRHLDGVTTTPRITLAWEATNNAKTAADNAAVIDLLKQVLETRAGQPVEIDYDRVGQASAKAIAEYVTISSETTTTATLKESA